MRKVRLLDALPPELLSLVLSQLQPQDMLVPRCSRRWRDADLDVLYWKQLFLNTFGEAAQTTKRTRKAAKARQAALASQKRRPVVRRKPKKYRGPTRTPPASKQNNKPQEEEFGRHMRRWLEGEQVPLMPTE